jgi:hypothetical protein
VAVVITPVLEALAAYLLLQLMVELTAVPEGQEHLGVLVQPAAQAAQEELIQVPVAAAAAVVGAAVARPASPAAAVRAERAD